MYIIFLAIFYLVSKLSKTILLKTSTILNYTYCFIKYKCKQLKIANNNTETYFYLDETIEDLSRSLKKNSDCLVNNNNCFTYTKGNRHISPINNHKQKRIYSSNSSKTNKMINNNANNVTSTGKFKRSSIVLKNKNAFNKSKIKINVENILNTDFKYITHAKNKQNSRIYPYKSGTNQPLLFTEFHTHSTVKYNSSAGNQKHIFNSPR